MPTPPPPPPPQAHQDEEPNQYTARRSYAGVLAIVLILILAVIVTLWILHNKNKTANNNPSVSQIQQMFQYNSRSIPTGTPPVITSKPTDQVSGAQTGYYPTTTPISAPPLQTQNYVNQDLGFQLQLPPNWQAKPFSSSEVILTSQTGQQASIQVYSNAPDLATIQTQLQGSQSVRRLSNTAFLNQPAIQFTTTFGQSGVAVINNGKLYYIIGPLSQPLLNSFEFLGQTNASTGF